MEGRIKVLPAQLVDQIAAGEVVERPASVVKELVENSLDAGATTITCQVEEGGRKRIRVIDDGQGMSRQDATLAIQRHATSKIGSADDLSRILTLGFRGEALPSIASVSRMRILTRNQGDDVATLLLLEGGENLEISDAGAPVGTEVDVADLFFNVPARRKFLRTQATEMSHILGWMIRLGLTRCQVHFRLKHGARYLLDAPGTADLAQRAATLLGREVFEHLHPVAHDDTQLQVSGLVSDPGHTRPNARGVNLFVNGRFVRDRLMQHAVMQGYRTVLPAGRYPTVVLHLQTEPGSVDVNVHPQKTEVRFVDSGSIHRALALSVGEVLARAPWMKGTRTYLLNPGSDKDSARTIERAGQLREALTRYQGHRAEIRADRRTLRPQEIMRPAEPPVDLPLSQLRLVGTLWNTYLLLSSPDRLLAVDQHAAAERITFERMRASAEKGEVTSQRLLVPAQLDLDGAALAVLETFRERLAEVGFEMEPFGPAVVNVTSVPALLAQAPVASVIRDVLDELAETGQGTPWEQARLEVLGRAACHASVRAGQALSETEARSLLEQLEQIDFAGTCPHGRPVLVEFGRSEVERWFRRT